MIFRPNIRANFLCLGAVYTTLLASGSLPAAELAEPVLVADFTPGNAAQSIPLYPSFFAVAGGSLYFSGTDSHGAEPWVSDGTAAGTRRFADLCPGPCSSDPGNFIQLGEQILFTRHRLDLYRYAAGQTELLVHLKGEVRFLARLGSILYVATRDGGVDRYYRTDGTRAGTRLTDDFCPGGPCVPPDELGVMENSIFFVSQGLLYRLASEGNPQPVRPMAHSGRNFRPFDSTRILFQGCEEGFDCHAWVSDGTAEGTLRLEDGSGTLTTRAANFLVWRGRAYFTNQAMQIVSTDGTAAGTRREDSFAGFKISLMAANASHLLYFSSDTDTIPATWRLRAINVDGSQSELLTSTSELRLIGKLDPKIFFLYHDGNFEILATTDGEPGRPEDLFASGTFAASSGIAYGPSFYFGRDQEGLWRSDGTLGGTTRIERFETIPFSSFTRPFRLRGSLIADPAADGLWRFDPQTLQGQIIDSRPLDIVVGNGEFLYAVDPLAPRLFAVHEDGVTATPLAGYFGASLAANGHLFYSGPSPGQQLWESDGTVAGTRELFDLEPGYEACTGSHHCEPSVPTQITPIGNLVFFVAKKPGLSGGEAYELWVWDGRQPVRLLTGFPLSEPITPLPDGRIAFVGPYAPEAGTGYWLSDGTPAGTYAFATGLPSNFGVLRAKNFGQRLAFILYSGDFWLWASDLTAAGTYPLSPEPYYRIDELVGAGGNLFFTGSPSQDQATELGFSDGTPEGTRWLELRPGIDGGNPQRLFALDDWRVVFAATGDAAGEELWISDGTAAGTYRLTDLAPGGESSSPSDFAQVGGRLFFQADDGQSGRELWALDPPPPAPCSADQVCLGEGRFEVEVTASTATATFRGRRVAGRGDSAVFTFFSADNWEMLVKVLDGCAINGHRWVFAAAATDVAWTLTVHDRQKGAARSYHNTLGSPSVAVTDSAAFACP